MKKQQIDHILSKMLDSHDNVSDLNLTPGKPLQVTLNHADGSTHSFAVNHTLTEEQISWFRAGSALNKIKEGGK